MALSVVSNVASLTGQHNLNQASSNLSKSLERLSSGLKINRGADGPASLVISEQQRAQITNLQSALDHTNKAINVVQTAEGALNEINKILGKVRGLALDSANSGVNDSQTLAANQAEIDNSLSTITNIINSTTFGNKKLLNGSADALTFQIGTQSDQTARLSISDARPSALGVVAGNKFGTLSAISVLTPSDAQEAIKVIDQAISDISISRGNLGAFQANTLGAAAAELRTTLENTPTTGATIRDTDFAIEMAQFTKQQVLLQAGSTALQNANQVPQLVFQLLRG